MLVLLLSSLVLLTPACSPLEAAEPVPAAVKPVKLPIRKVLVLEERETTAATRERQRRTRAALEEVLAEIPHPPVVEVLTFDDDYRRTRGWVDWRRPRTLPACYFLDGAGLPVEYREGDVPAWQFAELLAP